MSIRDVIARIGRDDDRALRKALLGDPPTAGGPAAPPLAAAGPDLSRPTVPSTANTEMTTPRRFVTISRTVQAAGVNTLDAIDEDGRAWWLILGSDQVPREWTEMPPLPSREDRP